MNQAEPFDFNNGLFITASIEEAGMVHWAQYAIVKIIDLCANNSVDKMVVVKFKPTEDGKTSVEFYHEIEEENVTLLQDVIDKPMPSEDTLWVICDGSEYDTMDFTKRVTVLFPSDY